MKNFLPYEYTVWLKKYALAHPKDPQIQTITSSLIKKLTNVQSFDELNELLESCLHYSEQTKDTPFALYGALTLNQTLFGWHQRLSELKKNHTQAMIFLAESDIATTFPAFGQLLNELMTAPKALIHSQTDSIFRVLRHKRFSELPEYLAQLEKSPAESSIPRSGSFSTIMPITAEHQACLHLLNKLSANFDEHNELFELSNNLLQTTLTVYQDVNFEEIDLDEIDVSKEETDSNYLVDLYKELTSSNDQDEKNNKKCTLQ